MRCKSCGHDNPPEARFCANCGSSLIAVAAQPASAVVSGAAPATPRVAGAYMGFWIRLAAAVLDGIIIIFISFFAFFRFGIFGFGFLNIMLPFPLVYWLYHWLFTGLRGQTLGKMAVGIKVVDEGGSAPGLGVAALREIPGKILSTIIIYVGFLWIIWDERKQGWHDKIAKTCVVRVKSRQEGV